MAKLELVMLLSYDQGVTFRASSSIFKPQSLGLSGLSGLLIVGFKAGFEAIDLARTVISELIVLSSVSYLVKTALHIDAVMKSTFC